MSKPETLIRDERLKVSLKKRYNFAYILSVYREMALEGQIGQTSLIPNTFEYAVEKKRNRESRSQYLIASLQAELVTFLEPYALQKAESFIGLSKRVFAETVVEEADIENYSANFRLYFNMELIALFTVFFDKFVKDICGYLTDYIFVNTDPHRNEAEIRNLRSKLVEVGLEPELKVIDDLLDCE